MLFDLRRRATQVRPKQCANSSGERHTPEIVALDQDGLPLSCGAKSCLGTGLSTLERWLGDGKANVPLLHNVRGSPVVLSRWDTWNRVARKAPFAAASNFAR